MVVAIFNNSPGYLDTGGFGRYFEKPGDSNATDSVSRPLWSGGQVNPGLHRLVWEKSEEEDITIELYKKKKDRGCSDLRTLSPNICPSLHLSLSASVGMS